MGRGLTRGRGPTHGFTPGKAVLQGKIYFTKSFNSRQRYNPGKDLTQVETYSRERLTPVRGVTSLGRTRTRDRTSKARTYSR